MEIEKTSPAPSTYTNAGTSPFWLTERQNKRKTVKEDVRVANIPTRFARRKKEKSQFSFALSSFEREFNDKKPGISTFGKSFKGYRRERKDRKLEDPIVTERPSQS